MILGLLPGDFQVLGMLLTVPTRLWPSEQSLDFQVGTVMAAMVPVVTPGIDLIPSSSDSENQVLFRTLFHREGNRGE